MTWAEAKTESDRIKAEAAAQNQELYLWADGARAGDIISTVTGWTVRKQGPPPPASRRTGSGGL